VSSSRLAFVLRNIGTAGSVRHTAAALTGVANLYIPSCAPGTRVREEVTSAPVAHAVSSPKEFEGRVALVTGGSRGIGRAICIMLAEHGAKVAINYVSNQAAAEEVLSAIDGRGMIVQGDQSSEADVTAMVAKVTQELGEVSLLVNNAGIAEDTTHSELTFEAWKRTMDVNVHGPFLAIWAVKDSMVKQKYGRIVNISSIAATTQPRPTAIDYATSKSALNSFTRHISAALAPEGVRVNCVAPGLTATELAMTANPGNTDNIIAGTPMQRIGQVRSTHSCCARYLLDTMDQHLLTSICTGRVKKKLTSICVRAQSWLEFRTGRRDRGRSTVLSLG
jgi:3-oxoacyl-[acyl-carrier protein] reductase